MFQRAIPIPDTMPWQISHVVGKAKKAQLSLRQDRKTGEAAARFELWTALLPTRFATYQNSELLWTLVVDIAYSVKESSMLGQNWDQVPSSSPKFNSVSLTRAKAPIEQRCRGRLLKDVKE